MEHPSNSALLEMCFKNVFILCARLHACLCAMNVPVAFGGQKTASHPLELELEVAVSLHVGAGNRTQVFCKSSQGFKLLSHFSNPYKCVF